MKVTVLPFGEINTDAQRFPGQNPDDPRYKRRILAEGDSWFSMGAVPIENLLLELDLPEKTVVVNLAEPGDEIIEMAKGTHSKAFKRLVAQKATAYSWSAILLSGGGNDLIARADDLFKSGDSVDTCINKQRLRECLKEVTDAYRTLAEIRDGAKNDNVECELIAHCYDYPTPRNAPALFFGKRVRGPWLEPAMSKKGIAEKLWIPLANRLMDELAESILALARGPGKIKRFSVVDTRSTLTPAELGTSKVSGDWRNEIHPTKDGYRLLNQKIASVIVSKWR